MNSIKGSEKEVVEVINKEKKFTIGGIVTEAFPAGKFNVELENGHEITRYISSKMCKYNIRVLLSDRVKVEMSPYDLDRGRIIYRYKRRNKPEIKKLVLTDQATDFVRS